MTPQKLLNAIKSGKTAFGMAQFSGAPSFVEIAAHAGFDFLYLDMHQAPLGLETMSHLVRAADAAGISSIVRVSENNPTEINRALNLGPSGIMVPHVDNVEDARKVVKATKYHPVGERQACPSVRAAQSSGQTWGRFTEQANEQTVVCVIIESDEAFANIDEIAALPGIDVLCIGPLDLATSKGLPDENLQHPELAKLLDSIAKSAKKHGKALWCTTVQHMNKKYVDFLEEKGVKLISFYSDEGIFLRACQRLLQDRGL